MLPRNEQTNLKGEKMISNVSFSGRETMLTKPVEKISSKLHEYVGASKVYSEAEIAKAQELMNNAKKANTIAISEKSLYTSPFAPIVPKDTQISENSTKHIDFFG